MEKKLDKNGKMTARGYIYIFIVIVIYLIVYGIVYDKLDRLGMRPSQSRSSAGAIALIITFILHIPFIIVKFIVSKVTPRSINTNNDMKEQKKHIKK